jgi:hypothetical protein
VKIARIAVASIVTVGLVICAVPAQASQSQASGKQQAIGRMFYKEIVSSYASDPKGLGDLCDLFAINSTSTTALFMSGTSDWTPITRQLGASMKDIRAGVKIALKKACA